MFTNEFHGDSTVTTLLDETGYNPDVIITIEDDGCVFIETRDGDNIGPMPDMMICLTPHMFQEMLQAFNTSEGAFRLERKYEV